MPTFETTAAGVYIWELEMQGGEVRHAFASNLATLINGTTPIVRALRGPLVDGAADDVPVLTSLSPTGAIVGAAAFTLHVVGTGFRMDSTVLLDGVAQATTLVNATEVTVAAAAVVGPPRSVAVTVRTATGLVSNALSFPITLVGE